MQKQVAPVPDEPVKRIQRVQPTVSGQMAFAALGALVGAAVAGVGGSRGLIPLVLMALGAVIGFAVSGRWRPDVCAGCRKPLRAPTDRCPSCGRKLLHESRPPVETTDSSRPLARLGYGALLMILLFALVSAFLAA